MERILKWENVKTKGLKVENKKNGKKIIYESYQELGYY